MAHSATSSAWYDDETKVTDTLTDVDTAPIDEPLRQAESIGRICLRGRDQRRRNLRRDDFTRLVVLPADQYERIARLGQFLHHHGRGDCFIQLRLRLLELCKLLVERPRDGRYTRAIMVAELALLLGFLRRGRDAASAALAELNAMPSTAAPPKRRKSS